MSLKGTIGRRIFAKALPAVPLAAAQAGDVLRDVVSPSARPACGQKVSTIGDAMVDQAWEAKRKKLDEARSFLYESGYHSRAVDYFRRRKNNWTTLDPNIIALRSVSDQHKIHMHIAAEEKLDEERNSWQNFILEKFGLDKKRDRYELF